MLKIKAKDIFLFLGILFLWILSGLIFPYNNDFYSLLKLPNFILPSNIFSYVWIILYILISISILLVIKTTNIFQNSDYLYVLITNYLANQLFSFSFFYLMSPFLAFVMTCIVFISNIFLFIETRNINKKASYFLIPYVLFSIYALIVSLSVYIMNF